MTSDRTQHQSQDELRRAQELSLNLSKPPSDLPGYKLQEHIGSGTFGEVWSALDSKTGRKVAIKFYTRRSKSDIRLMAAEVEKLAVLAADRYVVQLLDVGWDAEPPYYVMDYVEHGSLEDRLKGGQTMSTNDAVELFEEVVTGMMHLHGKGVLHCDLKPGNVLLDQDGKPRVADFGQSRLDSERVPSLGTLFYMAPEQASLDAVPDSRWDVYALGALLFCMLTGKPPYYSEETARQIEDTADIKERLGQYKTAIRSAEKPTEHRSVPGVDRSLADLIDRCIDPNPRTRMGSVEGVLVALRQRELIKARRPLLVLGLVGPLMLLLVMAFFGWSAYGRAITDTDKAITDKAIESNLYAARYAARSVTEQITEYMRLVKELGESSDFQRAFDKLTSNPQVSKLCADVADPNQNEKELEARVELRRRLERSDLQKILEKEILKPDHPETASWFVNDRAGTQIASVYEDPVAARVTLGKNYAYRTYFTGSDRDHVRVTDKGGKRYNVAPNHLKRPIIQQPHISAIFLSEGSNTWKFAFSTPLKKGNEVVGIVAVTVEVGHFVDFPNVDSQYAMLVDGRSGENKGVILEHPVFHSYLEKKQLIPETLARSLIDIESISNRRGFSDPLRAVSTAEGEGQKSADELLVARAPVYFARDNREAAQNSENLSERRETGLFVLAVEDYQAIVGPVRSLSQRLGQLGVLASLFFVLVTIGMWVLVMRMLRDSRRRLTRILSAGTEASLSGSIKKTS